ncbi:MAG: hypothetical protein ABR532_09015 [Candidatus Dormibacteria bacterium]
MPGLSEDLELNIAPSLVSVQTLAEALVQAATQFASALADALAGVTITPPDVSAITGDISNAVAAADTTVAVQPDTSAVSPDIEASIAEAPSVVTLDADGSAVTTEGDTAVQAIDGTVTLEADTSNLTAEGQAAAQSVFEQQVSNVAGGVGNSQGIIAEGAAATETAASVDILSTANKGLVAANAGLEGSVGGVTSALGPLGVALGTTAGIAGVLYEEAIQAAEGQQRLETVFGDSKETIESVNLPANNFNQTLKEIALNTGASLPGLEAANAHIGDLGHSAGATNPQIAETAHQITAIAAYLAVTNPQLGTADQIVSGLTSSLARGGRALANFGLAIPTADILQRAEQDTGKLAAQITVYDKAAAGAAITSEQLGPTLGAAYSQGAGSAVLDLEKLKESLKETVAEIGTPLIGPIEQAFTALGPTLGQVAAAIGHLLEAATPLVGVLGLVLKVLGDLASIVSAIPLPVLTAAVEAFTAALVVEKVSTFAAGLFTLGANATEDVGAVGLLTGSMSTLLDTLGPVGIAFGSIAALSVVSKAAAADNASEANKFAQSVSGLKDGTDLAKESASQLQQQLDAVNSKLAEIKKSNPSGSALVPIAASVDGTPTILNYTDATKALTAEQTRLQSALNTTKSSTDGLTGSQADGASAADAYSQALSKSVNAAQGVDTVLKDFSTTVNTDVSKASGQASTVFADVGSAAESAAKSISSSGGAATSAASQMASAAQHAKDLRDAVSALNTAEQDRATLAAGPTAEQEETGFLNTAQAAITERDAIQKVVDTRNALATLAAGPTAQQIAADDLTIAQADRTVVQTTQAVVDARNALNAIEHPSADTEAQDRENVAKGLLNEEKAALALSDARAHEAAVIAAGTATDRQKEDAANAVTEAEFGLTDATRTREQAEASLQKLLDDAQAGSQAQLDAKGKLQDAELSLEAAKQQQISAQQKETQEVNAALPGSAAYISDTNAANDAVVALWRSQLARADAQAAETKLYTDALPGSAAYIAATQKIADAEDHLTQVQESGAASAQKSAAAVAKAAPDALSALQKGLDDSIAAEDKFYADLAKIQSEGGLQIVAELLALGPQQGAAEASAVAAATPTVVSALETKTETLKAKEDQHAQEIASVFGTSLNAGLVDTFSKQLRNETDFFTNVQHIFDAGNTNLATKLLAQGPVQGAALAQAVASSTPQVQAALEAQARQLIAVENSAANPVGQSFAQGLADGASSVASQQKVILAGGILGGALVAATNKAIAAHSPSQVAMEIGGYWAEGLAAGVIGGVPLVASAAAQAASALVVSPSVPALATGSTVVGSATVSGATAGGAVVQHVTVNEVAQNPQATAFAVSSRLAQQATR